MLKLTLAHIERRFPTQASCIKRLEKIVWSGRPRCPYCGASRFTRLAATPRYHCNGCNTSFSVTARTLFHKTKIDLRKWFLAISSYTDIGVAPSSRKLAAALRIDKNTACYLNMRLRRAMATSPSLLLRIAREIEEP